MTKLIDKMKTYTYLIGIILVGSLLAVSISCKRETPKVIPTVTLTSPTNITANSATSGGSVTADGGDQVTARGVCWSSTNATPTISDSKTSDGTGTGSFSSSISGLTQGTTYNIRAYATNSVGTGYSSAATFNTLALAPTLTTTDLSAVTATSFNSGGNITNDGGSPVSARGVCWSINQNPTVSDSKTSDGTGTGIFTSTVTGLTPGTTYYVRAYATNTIGTTYGNQLTTKTSVVVPTLTTTAASSVTSTTASSGGNITSDGGGSITARGVCWSTTTSPTTASSKTSDATGTGVFTSNINGLIANTTYYVRAYATNSAGTAYGSEVSFKTLAGLPTLITTAVNSITNTTATSGGNISSDGGATITGRGVVWSINQNPTTTDSKTADATGTGVFTSLITGLTAGTNYYVRAYATNNAGTAYGNQVTFTTTTSAAGEVIYYGISADEIVSAEYILANFTKATGPVGSPTGRLFTFALTFNTYRFWAIQDFPNTGDRVIGAVKFPFGEVVFMQPESPFYSYYQLDPEPSSQPIQYGKLDINGIKYRLYRTALAFSSSTNQFKVYSFY